jgi:hypothetical protein
MAGMQLADKVLVHQVHPAKLGADVTASLVSNVLLWKAQPKNAVALTGAASLSLSLVRPSSRSAGHMRPG